MRRLMALPTWALTNTLRHAGPSFAKPVADMRECPITEAEWQALEAALAAAVCAADREHLGLRAEEGLADPVAAAHFHPFGGAQRHALEVAGLPAAEVHLSDVMAREPFRHTSVVRDLCLLTVSGRGPDGYRDALVALRDAHPG